MKNIKIPLGILLLLVGILYLNNTNVSANSQPTISGTFMPEPTPTPIQSQVPIIVATTQPTQTPIKQPTVHGTFKPEITPTPVPTKTPTVTEKPSATKKPKKQPKVKGTYKSSSSNSKKKGIKISKDEITVSKDNNTKTIFIKYTGEYGKKKVKLVKSVKKLNVKINKQSDSKYNIIIKGKNFSSNDSKNIKLKAYYTNKNKKKWKNKVFRVTINIKKSSSSSRNTSNYDDQEGKEEHTHNWEVIDEREPTCTQEGSVTYKCSTSSCKETKTEKTNALGHDNIIMDASISGYSASYNYCLRCGNLEYVEKSNSSKESNLYASIVIIRFSSSSAKVYYNGKEYNNKQLETILCNDDISSETLGVKMFDLEGIDKAQTLSPVKQATVSLKDKSAINSLEYVLSLYSFSDTSNIDNILAELKRI